MNNYVVMISQYIYNILYETKHTHDVIEEQELRVVGGIPVCML